MLILVDGRQFCQREKFSSGMETVVGSLWLLAVFFSWWYILVGWYNLGLSLNRSCWQE
jgi:hypothetical protein